MTEVEKLKYLRVALVVIGFIFIFGIWPLTVFWPSGWAWHNVGRSYYLEMILAVYATLGVFLIMASRNPLENRSLILFTIWSSFVHAGVMAQQALTGEHQIGHLYGDVPALFIIGGVLAYLLPKTSK
jgi:hypothetical protein